MSGVACQVSDVRCQMSGVRCQVSHVGCHMSFITCILSHFFSQWSGCNQQGLPCLAFRLFDKEKKNVLIPKIYLSWLVVVQFWPLKKENWWEFIFSETLEYARNAKRCKLRRPPNRSLVHILKVRRWNQYFFSNLSLDIFPWVFWLLFHGSI